ncbi:hypothetical protein AgCh_002897 [Apium graveolens]
MPNECTFVKGKEDCSFQWNGSENENSGGGAVHEDSPADEAGVCPGDLIKKLMAPKPISISSVSEYSRRMSNAYDFLSTSC